MPQGWALPGFDDSGWDARADPAQRRRATRRAVRRHGDRAVPDPAAARDPLPRRVARRAAARAALVRRRAAPGRPRRPAPLPGGAGRAAARPGRRPRRAAATPTNAAPPCAPPSSTSPCCSTSAASTPAIRSSSSTRTAARSSRSPSPRACPANGPTRRRRSRASSRASRRRRRSFATRRAPGVQRFERFEWAAVRYAQLTVRNAPRGLRIRHVGSTFTHYPAEPRGAFECSDPLLTRLWEIGRYTLLLCMHDGWEDCPSREQRQWLGDATVELLVGQVAFGPSVNALNRQFLRHAAESQRPDGLTQMFAPGDHHTDAIVIPDWTLQWILNAEQHWLYSGELDVIEAIFPAIQRALAWFERHLDANDLVADLPFWHFMDWAALGRRGEAAALNAQFVGALRAAARLAGALELARAGAPLRGARRAHRRGARRPPLGCAPRRLRRRRRSGQRRARICASRSTRNGAAILWDVAPRAALGVDHRAHHRSGAPDVHRRAADRAGRRDARSGIRRRAGQHVLQPLRLSRPLQSGPLRPRPAPDARALRPHAGARRDHALGELRPDRQPVSRLLRHAGLSALDRGARRRPARAPASAASASPRSRSISPLRAASCRPCAATSRSPGSVAGRKSRSRSPSPTDAPPRSWPRPASAFAGPPTSRPARIGCAWHRRGTACRAPTLARPRLTQCGNRHARGFRDEHRTHQRHRGLLRGAGPG